MFWLYSPVILELILRTTRNCTRMRFLNWTATQNRIGMIASTISANCQLIQSMKIMAVTMLNTAQVTSTIPQVTSWAMRSESEVTRDMIQPTGVRLK